MEKKQFDKTKFSQEGYLQKIEEPWGYELIFTSKELPYSGKIMHIEAGKRQSLQYHDEKQETYYLVSGRGGIVSENSDGEMVTVEFEENKGYTTAVGQKHRLFGITDCDIVEVATPEIGTTFRLEDDYGRSDETPEVRDAPNRGWKG